MRVSSAAKGWSSAGPGVWSRLWESHPLTWRLALREGGKMSALPFLWLQQAMKSWKSLWF